MQYTTQGDNGRFKAQQSVIYNTDGTLKPEAIDICSVLAIKTENLIPRNLEYFISQNVTDKIAELRLSHHEQKRREKIQQITDYLKAGKLESPSKPKDNTKINLDQLLTSLNLDSEFENNRKLAKQIYELELLEKVKVNKQIKIESDEQRRSQLAKDYEKSVSAIERQFKIKHHLHKEKVKQSEISFQEQRRKRARKLKQEMEESIEKNNEIIEELTKFRESQEQKDRKVQDQKQKAELEWQRTKQQRSQLQTYSYKKEDLQIQQKLMLIEQKINDSLLKKNQQKERVVTAVRSQLDNYEKKVEQIRARESPDKVSPRSIKISESLVKRFASSKARRKDYMQEQLEPLHNRLEQSTQIIKEKQREMYFAKKESIKSINERRNYKERIAQEVIEAVQFENQQRREFAQLRRFDQYENFQRKVNFEKLVTQKLAEEIIDKKERGDLLLSQQKRIAELCFGKRAEFKGYVSQTNRNSAMYKSIQLPDRGKGRNLLTISYDSKIKS